MGTSRLPGFYKMKIAERLRRLASELDVGSGDLVGLGETGTLPLPNADAMIENAVGVLGLPVGLGLNFLVNGEDVLVPMAVEGPSLIAAASPPTLAVRGLARATGRVPFEALTAFGFSGAEVAHGIAEASLFADADPYRACTHNKGVMNGVDAVALATGNDWRAIEAGAHAWACRNGRYQPLSQWWIEDGNLFGRCELPIQVGTVGGAVKSNPLVPVLLRILGNPGPRKLASIMAAVGLAQNMAALRALGSVGIQKGHMALHARSVALSAGARGTAVEEVARALIAAGEIKLHRAQEILAKLVSQKAAAEVT